MVCKANYPVGGVTLSEARAFCRWLTRKDKEYDFRLPFHYEWDRASGLIEAADSVIAIMLRSKSRRPARSHEQIQELFECVAAALAADDTTYRRQIEHSIASGGGGLFTQTPVGAFDPNEIGLHDLIGGVWEWCCTDSEEVVVKGGPVREQSSAVWAAIGTVFDSAIRFDRLGFRLCRTRKVAQQVFH